ncbi:MAG: hypothetical protein R2695_16685 [Acidimicrobiales bacterium]
MRYSMTSFLGDPAVRGYESDLRQALGRIDKGANLSLFLHLSKTEDEKEAALKEL